MMELCMSICFNKPFGSKGFLNFFNAGFLCKCCVTATAFLDKTGRSFVGHLG
jgi:hypothetical protein